MPEKNKFLRGQIAWLGFNQTEVLIDIDERMFGKTNYTYSKMIKLALDAITSLLISFVSFIIILFALYSQYILERTITSWTSIIINSSFVLNRSTYIIDETNIENKIKKIRTLRTNF